MRKNSFSFFRFFGILFVLILIFFSGCALKFPGSGSGAGTGGNKNVDTSGKGLEVNFKLDDEWISTKRLDYTITLKNTGLNPVEIGRENVKLSTIEQDNLESVFTSESLDAFYNSIVTDNGKLILHHDEKREDIRGSLYIKDSVFEDLTKEQINYVLEFNYDYETEFSNNLEFDLSKVSIMRVLDTVSQAAPVNIVDIEVTPYQGNEYILKYTFRDNGPSMGYKKRTVKISKNEMDFVFRQKKLSTSSCKILTRKNDGYVEMDGSNIILNDEYREVILGCVINLQDIEKSEVMTTATAGTFKYDYVLDIQDTIRLPETRSSFVNWG